VAGHFCYCVTTEARKLEEISVNVDEKKFKFTVHFSASDSLYISISDVIHPVVL